MLNIQRSSRYMRMIFQTFLVVIPLLFVLFWINATMPVGLPEYGFSYRFMPEGIRLMHDLTWQERIIGAFISAGPMACYLFMLSSLTRLFRLYEKGIVFTEQNVNYLKNIGKYVIYAQIANFITHPLMTLAMSLGNPPGQGNRYIELTLVDTNIGLFVFGIIVVIIARIMQEATNMHNEQQLTI